MPKEHRSPGAGEGGGSQLGARRSSRGRPWLAPRAVVDDAHNTCADKFPPNRYPGKDVLVDGRHFDALQVGARVLWEIKTDQYDTYSAFLKKRVVEDQIEEFKEERSVAEACGYAFKVGVSSEAHKAALLGEDDTFDVVVTGCKR